MSRFLSEKFGKLIPYVPGEQPRDQAYIKLNTNESPFPPSPSVTEAINEYETGMLNRYSDPTAKSLIYAIAEKYGVKSENVFVSNGSDEALAFIFNAFFSGGRSVVFPDVTYGFYPVFADFFGIEYRTVALDADYRINVEDYSDVTENVVIANPNAQTGVYLDPERIETLVSQNSDRIVVIDEAYIDFGGVSAVPLIDKYDNLIVVQTFSKSRNLAGARIGMAFACKELINDLNTMKFSFNPYNVNRLSLIAGERAVRDGEYMKKCISEIIESRAYTVGALEKLDFYVLPSMANFVLARTDRMSGKELYEGLKSRAILVRHFPDERITDFVRITIGTKEQMRALIEAIEDILK